MEVVVNPEKMELDPSYKVSAAIFNQVMDLWEEYVKDVNSLVGDKIFEPFTKYV